MTFIPALDDTQALDASSSGEEGRRRDLEESIGAEEDDETSSEYGLEDPLSRSATLSPENDPCRLGCCALLSQRNCEAHLLLLSSCRPTMDVPHIVHLGKDRCTIGRAIESDVYLDSVAYPRTLSREHAVIERRGPCDYVLKDLRSVNGVSVNGKSVREVQALAPGDVILFGRRTPQPEFEYLFEVEDFRAYRRPRAEGQVCEFSQPYVFMIGEDRKGLKRSREDGGGENESKVLRLDGMPPVQVDNG
ncbi:hypothetical protein FOL47_007144 [Perkinsus chesapeaki]|uniref:FHA domain-containing protein n=1 Tax=Perkinsus chesapeaki TaxID=330153 RepID=A0A7J6LNJ7_PERCH|nr:hypothetical protein FOL47_007144 [Perkinsus chesapeaki]